MGDGRLDEVLEHALETPVLSMKAADEEAVWVEASRRGDTRAFNRLILKWEQAIFNVALRILEDREEATEISQEVFLAAYRGIRKFRGDSRFSTWLYRIAVNLSLNRARQRPRAPALLEGEESVQRWPTVEESQEKGLLARERRALVRQALSSLPVEQRVVVELKFYREQTFEEIARVMEIPTSTVKSRFYAALEILRDRLSESME